MRDVRLRHVITALLALSACSAGWSSVVRYSDAPAPAGADVEEGVYEAVLGDSPGSRVDTVIYDRWAPRMPFGRTGWADSQVPSFWVDTLKRELDQALASPALWTEADSARLTEAASAHRTVLVWPRGDDTLAILTHQQIADRHYRFTENISLSRPGFNADSTIAVIRVSSVCGVLCGGGRTLFLARHPGTKWRVWGGHTDWVS